MIPRHCLFALTSLATASVASAELTNVFATTAIITDTYLEIEGAIDDGPLMESPFSLGSLGSLNESSQSAAGLPNGDATAISSANGSFSSTTDTITLNMLSTASTTLDARTNDTFSLLKARSATVVGFTTDEHVRVTLTGDASIAFDLNGLANPIELPTLVDIIEVGGSDNPVFEIASPNDEFAFSFILAPGQYRLRMAADTTFQTFGFPENLYTADSELNLALLIAPVPAPSATLLFPLAAALSTRRRR